MKHKVFFDTNIIRNTDFNTFFGNQEKLKELSYKADIMIPEIVFSEIVVQKRFEYHEGIIALNKNKVYRQIESTEIFDLEQRICDLINEIDFKYEIIKVNKKDALDNMMNLALNKCAPFEENCDKGFKDSCIYYSILEYIEEDKTSRIFLCCKDGRLNKALESIKRVEYVDFDKIDSMFVDKYRDPYFISLLNSEIDFGFIVSDKDIIDFYENYLENDVIVIKVPNEKEPDVLVEISDKEFISIGSISEKEKAIDTFLRSGSFYSTHRNLITLLELVQFINGQDIIEIIQGILANQQIWYLLNDDDIKQFISDMLEFIRIHVHDCEVIDKFNDYSEIKI